MDLHTLSNQIQNLSSRVSEIEQHPNFNQYSSPTTHSNPSSTGGPTSTPEFQTLRLQPSEPAAEFIFAVGNAVIRIADSVERLADHLTPTPSDIVDTSYIAGKLGVTKTWVAKMAQEGQIPSSCILTGTGKGKLWKFHRKQIDLWIESR
jgi:hypothetical protein